MGITKLIKKGFGKHKKYYLEIPEEFVSECDVKSNDVVCSEAHNCNFVVIGNSNELNLEHKQSIASLVGLAVDDHEINMKLMKSNNDVTYKEVSGFFMFRDVIYYRTHGAAAKYVGNESISFTEHIRTLYPEFQDIRATEVSTLMVTPLKVQ